MYMYISISVRAEVLGWHVQTSDNISIAYDVYKNSHPDNFNMEALRELKEHNLSKFWFTC